MTLPVPAAVPPAGPITELDARYSAPDASATPWDEASGRLREAKIFSLCTVRADGRPHATPLLAVWDGGALHFCTGPLEQKARNLAGNAQCLLVAGTGDDEDVLEVVLEGVAHRVTDDDRLVDLAHAWWSKYGEPWRFLVADGGFVGGGGNAGPAHVFAVRPVTAYAYRTGDPFGMTRYRF